MNEAANCLSAVKKAYGLDMHYTNSKQTKQIDAKVRALRKWGRKNAAQTTDDARRVSQDCFQEADDIEERQHFFTECRVAESFETTVVSDMERARFAQVTNMAVGDIAKIVIVGCATLSEPALTTSNAAIALLQSVVCDSSLLPTPGFGLHMYFSEVNMDVVFESQGAALLAHLERICKIGNMEMFVKAAELISAPFAKPKHSTELMLKLTAMDPDTRNILGFFPQMFVDLVHMLLLSKVGPCMTGNQKVPRDTVHLAKTVITSVAYISPRIRCYHKSLNSNNSSLPIKKIWDKACGIAQCKAVKANEVVPIEEIEKWVKVLTSAMETAAASTRSDAAEGDMYAVANAIVDFMNDNEVEKMIQFAKWFADPEIPEAARSTEDKALMQIGIEMNTIMWKVASSLIVCSESSGKSLQCRRIVREQIVKANSNLQSIGKICKPYRSMCMV